VTSTTFDKVLHEAQQLTSEEQERLADALRRSQGARVATVQQLETLLQQGLRQPRPLSGAEQTRLDMWVAETRKLAARIGETWQDGSVSAADAVHEQRR
jgi:glutathione S-transferase